MRRALCAVALLALACLLVRAARVGLAGDYIDPISKISTQDEALYAHSAIAMARQGDWLTPRFMGRYALYKPPLLIWAAAASSKLLGVSRLSLRLPIALLSALALGLIFLWAGELAGWQAGAVAGALLLSNHLWHTLAALCMTDGLLLAFYIAAFYALFCDPWLESRAALVRSSAPVAAASPTQGARGHPPAGLLGAVWGGRPPPGAPGFLARLSGRGFGPGLRRTVVPLPVRGPPAVVLDRALRRRDPRLRRRRAPPDLAREPGAVLPDAPRRHRPASPGRRGGGHSGLPLRPAAAHGGARAAGRLDGRHAGRHAWLAVPQCLVSVAAGARAGAARRRLGPVPHAALRPLDVGGPGCRFLYRSQRTRTPLGPGFPRQYGAGRRADTLRLLRPAIGRAHV